MQHLNIKTKCTRFESAQVATNLRLGRECLEGGREAARWLWREAAKLRSEEEDEEGGGGGTGTRRAGGSGSSSDAVELLAAESAAAPLARRLRLAQTVSIWKHTIQASALELFIAYSVEQYVLCMEEMFINFASET